MKKSVLLLSLFTSLLVACKNNFEPVVAIQNTVPAKETITQQLQSKVPFDDTFKAVNVNKAREKKIK